MNATEAILRATEVIRLQHKAPATQRAYLYWLRRYIRAVCSMATGLTSEQKLERFLTHLATKSELSASSQNQAFNAIVFFYEQVLKKPLQNVEAFRSLRPVHTR